MWDHPHRTNRGSGKGPKGKRQRRAKREQATADRQAEAARRKRDDAAMFKDRGNGTLASIGWKPGQR